MYYSYIEIEYVAMSFSPTRTDLALKLLKKGRGLTLFFPTPMSRRCACILERCLLFGMGHFLLAQTVNPIETDTTTYLHYVVAAVHGNAALR
jgi:hypothetical protein